MKEPSKIDPETLVHLLDIINSEGMMLYVRPYHPFGNLLGIIIGGLVCLGGFIAIILGLTGTINWLVKAGALSSKLTNASPGVFLSLTGMVIIWRYKLRGKYRVEITPASVEITKDKMKMVGPKIKAETTSSSPITAAPPRRFY